MENGIFVEMEVFPLMIGISYISVGKAHWPTSIDLQSKTTHIRNWAN